MLGVALARLRGVDVLLGGSPWQTRVAVLGANVRRALTALLCCWVECSGFGSKSEDGRWTVIGQLGHGILCHQDWLKSGLSQGFGSNEEECKLDNGRKLTKPLEVSLRALLDCRLLARKLKDRQMSLELLQNTTRSQCKSGTSRAQ